MALGWGFVGFGTIAGWIKAAPKWAAKLIEGRIRAGWIGMTKEYIYKYIPCDSITKLKCDQPHAENVTDIPLPFYKVDCEAVVKVGYLTLHNIKTEESRFVTISNTTLQDVNHDTLNNKAAREVYDRDDDEDDEENDEENGPVVQNVGNDEDAMYLQDLYGHVLVADPQTKEEQGQFEFRMCPGNRSDEYWRMAGFLWYGRLTPTTPGHDYWRSRICIQAGAFNNTDSSEYLLATTPCAGRDFEEGKALGFIYGPNPASDLKFVGMTPDGEASTTEPMFRVNVDDSHVLRMPYFNATHFNATYHGRAGDWRLQLI